MNLSKLAVKRLQKEMKDLEPLLGMSIAPEGDDLSKWHANVEVQSGAYAGINFHCLIEVPDNYPTKAPSAYFKSSIRYTMGSSLGHVEGKGEKICLNLLGTYIGPEVPGTGWSPSNCLQTVLIQLQVSCKKNPEFLFDHAFVGNYERAFEHQTE